MATHAWTGPHGGNRAGLRALTLPVTNAAAFVAGALVCVPRFGAYLVGAQRGLRLVARLVAAASVAALVLLGFGPRLGTYRVLTVLSGSMAPTMPVGALVVAVPVPLDTVQVGDVITFHAPSDRAVVTHRVIEIVEPGDTPVVRTKGDANRSPDPWTARLLDGPAWRTKAVVPGAGYALMALRSPAVRGLAFAVAPLVLAVALVRAIWRRRPVVEPGVPLDLGAATGRRPGRRARPLRPPDRGARVRPLTAPPRRARPLTVRPRVRVRPLVALPRHRVRPLVAQRRSAVRPLRAPARRPRPLRAGRPAGARRVR